MKNIQEVNVDSKMFENLDSALRQSYVNALNSKVEEGFDPRQILATDISKTDFSISIICR